MSEPKKPKDRRRWIKYFVTYRAPEVAGVAIIANRVNRQNQLLESANIGTMKFEDWREFITKEYARLKANAPNATLMEQMGYNLSESSE